MSNLSSATILQVGLDLDASVVGGSSPYTYEWNTTETTQNITPVINGLYWLVITDANGCISDTSFINVTWLSTSVKNLNIDKLAIYPNPSKDVFNVEFTNLIQQDIDLRVISVVGELVYTEDLQQFSGEYTKEVDLKTYSKGIYFLEITTNSGVVNKKLILQ